jgi:adenylate cyclase
VIPVPAGKSIKVGFQTSVIALFFGIVLFVGLALVYLSLSRVTSITRAAASSFLDTVAQLATDRIDGHDGAGQRGRQGAGRAPL